MMKILHHLVNIWDVLYYQSSHACGISGLYKVMQDFYHQQCAVPQYGRSILNIDGNSEEMEAVEAGEQVADLLGADVPNSHHPCRSPSTPS